MFATDSQNLNVDGWVVDGAVGPMTPDNGEGMRYSFWRESRPAFRLGDEIEDGDLTKYAPAQESGEGPGTVNTRALVALLRSVPERQAVAVLDALLGTAAADSCFYVLAKALEDATPPHPHD